MTRKLVQRARARLSRVAFRPASTAVEIADRTTSKADARAAVCLARGVAVDDLDPANGTNWSRAAFEAARQSWIRLLAGHPVTSRIVRDCRAAGERWALRRPEWVAELPWPQPAACDTCDTPEGEWDTSERLYQPGSHRCPWCTEETNNPGGTCE